MSHGLSVATKVLKRKQQEAANVTGVFEEALDQLTQPLDPSSCLKIDAFVISFCARADKSVHWLHYGHQGHGFAIGIDSARLEQPDWQSVPVLYDEHAQESVLNTVFDTVNTKFLETIDSVPVQYHPVLKLAAVTSVVSWTRALAPCFKSAAFREEEEWRIFRLHIESSQISKRYEVSPQFRARGHSIIPYTILQISTGNECPIREVVFGSQIDHITSTEALTFLFRKLGQSPPTFQQSLVPLRGE